MRNLFPLLACLLLLVAEPGVAQDEVAMTNLRAYELLATRIGDSLNQQIPAGDSLRIFVSVKPEATAWLVQGGIAQALQVHGRSVVVAMPAGYQADLGIRDMRVTYGNVHTEGLFSGKVADREILLGLGARLVNLQSGVVTLSTEYRESLHDTVLVSAIPMLEDPNVPVTQGALPPEGFFSSLVEPLVMLGAVAVAVYLLFSVRS